MSKEIISIFELILGIVILFSGGEFFVRGSVELAKILKIPQLVIGLTIVALGTSSPELFVSLNSLYKGSDALAVSNVVGSNIFNIFVVLGLSALISPLKVDNRLLKRDVPLLIGVSGAVWGISSSGKLSWQPGLFLLFILFINTIWEIRKVNEDVNDEVAKISNKKDSIKSKFFIALVNLFGGIVLLTFGSNLLVKSATYIAQYLGVNEIIIGLTIVSVGTSLPELITSLVATFRGRTDLAIGNVIGSCLLNQLFVLSSCAISSGSNGLVVESALINKDFPIMVISTLVCMPIFWTKGKISRLEGFGLFSCYILYVVDKIIPYINILLIPYYRIFIIYLFIPIATLVLTFKSFKFYYLSKNN